MLIEAVKFGSFILLFFVINSSAAHFFLKILKCLAFRVFIKTKKKKEKEMYQQLCNISPCSSRSEVLHCAALYQLVRNVTAIKASSKSIPPAA